MKIAPPRPRSRSPKPSSPFQRRLAVLRADSFLTNDLFELLVPHRRVLVNGNPLAWLKGQDVAVLFVLAWQGVRAPGLPLSAKDIVAQIEEGILPPLLSCKPSVEDVHRAVNRLRDALARARLNPFLVETMDGHRGYRLSTPPANIALILQGAAGEFSASIGAQGSQLLAAPGEDVSGETVAG